MWINRVKDGRMKKEQFIVGQGVFGKTTIAKRKRKSEKYEKQKENDVFDGTSDCICRGGLQCLRR